MYGIHMQTPLNMTNFTLKTLQLEKNINCIQLNNSDMSNTKSLKRCTKVKTLTRFDNLTRELQNYT